MYLLLLVRWCTHEVLEDDGEKVKRQSTLYRKDRWDEYLEDISPDKQKKLSWQYEKRLNKDTGKLEQWVRLFDTKDGILRSELYKDNKVRHKQLVDD